ARGMRRIEQVLGNLLFRHSRVLRVRHLHLQTDNLLINSCTARTRNTGHGCHPWSTAFLRFQVPFCASSPLQRGPQGTSQPSPPPKKSTCPWRGIGHYRDVNCATKIVHP